MKAKKRFISLFVCLLMVLEIMPANVFSAFAEKVPIGFTPLCTVEDLYSMRYGLNKNYILMNDIDLTAATAQGGECDEGYGWTPIGEDADSAFTGIFDGNGYTISGMRISGANGNNVGLFGYIKGGTVQNLKLVDVNIDFDSTKEFVGAVCGCGEIITLTKVSVDGNVNASASSFVGGLIGNIKTQGMVSLCYNKASVTGVFDVGGIAGAGQRTNMTNDIHIENCYNTGAIISTKGYACGILGCGTGFYDLDHPISISFCINLGSVSGSYVGAIAGCEKVQHVYHISISYCYYPYGMKINALTTDDIYSYIVSKDSFTTATTLTLEQFKHECCFGWLDFDNVWVMDIASGAEHPQLRDNREYPDSGVLPEPIVHENEPPEGYIGIYTVEDLYAIRNDLDKNYILMNDIDLSAATAEGSDWDVGYGWTPIGENEEAPFSGTFNGNDHTISGLQIRKARRGYTGLFGYIQDGTVENLKLTDVNIAGNGAIGSYGKNVTLTRISVEGTISGGATGGIIGTVETQGLISLCYNKATVTGSSNVGGIVGIAKRTDNEHNIIIENCYNKGTVTSKDSSAGGILGNGSGYKSGYYLKAVSVVSCVNLGAISGSYIGGIAGGNRESSTAAVDLSNCYYIYGVIPSGALMRGWPLVENSPTTAVMLSTEEMKQESSFPQLDFNTVWFIDSSTGCDHPQLRENIEAKPIERIEIKTAPTQTTYFHHEPLDVSGGLITVTYKEGYGSEDIAITEDMLSGYNTNMLGEQTVYVSYCGFSDSFTITVNELPVASVTINKNKTEIDIGKTETLIASVLPKNATDQQLTWESDEEDIATVDENGVVTAISKGIALITATAKSGASATCIVKVLVPATDINLNTSEASINRGENLQLIAELVPSISTDTYSWSSGNNAVATVDQNGLVTPVKGGTTLITATSSRGIKKSCNVTVFVPADKVILNEESYTLDVGNVSFLSASLSPSDSTDTITWDSSAPEVVSVSPAGKITAKSGGTAIITATTNRGKKADCSVFALVPATGITLDKTELSLNKGESYTLTATLAPEESNDSYTWSSSAPSVVSVENGKVTANAAGTAIISATSSRGLKADCEITVYAPATAISLNKTNADIDINKTLTLTATLSPDDCTDTVEWSSSDSSVASVSNDGVVTAKAKGAVVITATAESGKTANCTINVLVPAKKITLSSEFILLEEGQTAELSASMEPANTTDTMHWFSSDEKIVTVSADGKLTVTGKGTATVTAETSRGLKAVCTVKVKYPAESVYFDITTVNIDIGKSVKTTAHMLPVGANDDIAWTSSDDTIASVSADGTVIALKKGTATITATTESGKTASYTLTVLVPATGISVDHSSLTIEEESIAKLTASLVPTNSTDSITWSTSDSRIATVSNGTITAVKAGTVTITAKAASGKTVSCIVTVTPLPTYKISYDANGGVGTPSTQTKTKGENITLSTSKPTKSFVISYNANGGSVSPASKSLNCIFTGWNTAVNGKGAAYSSGASYTANSDATLYAQWNNPTAGTLATPTRSGYTFTGWYTSTTGGEKVSDSSIVTASKILYARWEKTKPANIYNLKEETYKFGNYGDSDSCGGHCFGMSITSSAYYLGLLDLTEIGGKKGDKLYDFSFTDTVKAPICHYQQIQGSRSANAIVAGGSKYLKGYNNITADWNAVVNYVKSHDFDDLGALQIGFRKDGEGGHAINFLRYANVNGQDRIYAYDNNFPDKETYFYMAGGQVYQTPVQTFSGAIDCICLRDINKYFSSVSDFDATRAVYIAKESATVQGLTYSYMEGEIENVEYVMYEIPSSVDKIIIIPEVDNADFIYLGTEYSFGKITDDTYGELKLETMSEGALVQSASFTIKSGKNAIKYGDVDGDGKVSAADARLALRKSVGLENYKEGSDAFLACDVDFDGKVSAADARLILRASVGLENPKNWK